ncbi:MAG: hypothetical protein ACON4V_00275 [Parvibaculales bacterium]
MTISELAVLLERQTYLFSKTMPEHPHFYTLRESWSEADNFLMACHWIRVHSYVEWFQGRPYEMFAAGDWKYWTMGYPIDETILINRTLLDGRGVVSKTGEISLHSESTNA